MNGTDIVKFGPNPPSTTGISWRTHLGCGSDDGLQCCRRPWGIAGVAAGVLCAVIVVVVIVGGGALQQVLPSSRRLCLRVQGGGGERS